MKQKHNLKIIRHLFLFGLGVVIIVVLYRLGGSEDLSQFRNIQLLPLVGALFTTLGIIGAISLRWGSLVNIISGRKQTSWTNYFHYVVISRVVGFILPKDITDLGGRTAWLVARHDISISVAGASVLLDRLFDLLTASIFLMACLPYWFGWVGSSAGLALMAGMAGIVYLAIWFGFDRGLKLLSPLFWKGLRFAEKVPRIRASKLPIDELRQLNNKLFSQLYLMGIAKFIFTTSRFILISAALELQISPEIFILATAVGQFSYLFAFTPGGLGIFETGWFAILVYAGIASEAVTTFVVGQRVMTTLLVIVLAILSQLYFLLRNAKVKAAYS